MVCVLPPCRGGLQLAYAAYQPPATFEGCIRPWGVDSVQVIQKTVPAFFATATVHVMQVGKERLFVVFKVSKRGAGFELHLVCSWSQQGVWGVCVLPPMQWLKCQHGAAWWLCVSVHVQGSDGSNWMQNMECAHTEPLGDLFGAKGSDLRLHKGFYEGWKALEPDVRAAVLSFVKEVSCMGKHSVSKQSGYACDLCTLYICIQICCG